MLEFLLEFMLLIIIAYVYARIQCPPSWEEKHRARREFYSKRDEEYINALPSEYPYIAGWDGVDSGDLAIVKTDDCCWTVMSMKDAIETMPIHPAVFSDVYVGDGYRSINQMRQDFENE